VVCVCGYLDALHILLVYSIRHCLHACITGMFVVMYCCLGVSYFLSCGCVRVGVRGGVFVGLSVYMSVSIIAFAHTPESDDELDTSTRLVFKETKRQGFVAVEEPAPQPPATLYDDTIQPSSQFVQLSPFHKAPQPKSGVFLVCVYLCVSPPLRS